MSIPRAFIQASIAVALTSVTCFTTSASGQSSPAPAPVPAPQTATHRYRDGIVIWETPPDESVPFLLKLNVNTQLRYLNTQSSDETFTDHLGVGHEVHTRNDITVNRAMFILGGYIFDRGRDTASPSGSAGLPDRCRSNIGWQFSSPAITGLHGVPGSRSLVNGSHFHGN